MPSFFVVDKDNKILYYLVNTIIRCERKRVERGSFYG